MPPQSRNGGASKRIAGDTSRLFSLASVLAALAGCGDDLAPESAAVSVRWSSSSMQLREGEQSQLEISLDAPPSRALLLELRTPDGAAIQIESAPLLFTAADYATPRQVTVRALHDDDAVDGSAVLGLDQTDDLVEIQIVDDDELGVRFDQPALSLLEAGTTEVGVFLGAKPPGELRISLHTSDPAVLQLSHAELSFSPESWKVPQRVVLNSATDLDGDDELLELRTGGPTAERKLPVQIIDKERQAILSNVSSVSMGEGFSRPVMVSLNTAPKTPVTVSFAVANPALATVSPTSLTFTRDDYTTSRRVTVQSLVDIDTVNGTTSLVASAAGIPVHAVAVEVIDATVLGMTVSPALLTLAEGASGELSVQLTALPQAAVTVTCESLDASAATTQPSTLTFQPQSWNVPQAISVRALDDMDNADELVSVRCSSPSLASRSGTISIIDDEPRFCGDGVCSTEEWLSCACDMDCEELGCPESVQR
jgi:hypothetical protein